MTRSHVREHRWPIAIAATVALSLGTVACAPPDDTGEGDGTLPADTAAPASVDGTAAEVSIADAGLSTPESVLHDEAADIYLVSNIAGESDAKDGNGFISRVSPDGEVEELRWIDGGAEGVTLHAPKGMAVAGDSLFATDIDTVRIFDRETGEPVGAWGVEDAVFLNDAVIGPDGALYVTDSGMGDDGRAAVYRFDEDGTPSALAHGAELNGPNGLAATEDGVIVVTFGANRIDRIDGSGERTLVAELPGGQLDGVVRLADESFLVSSWEDEAIYRVREGVEPEAIVENIVSPADIGYDATRNRVLTPLFREDRVTAHAVH